MGVMAAARDDPHWIGVHGVNNEHVPLIPSNTGFVDSAPPPYTPSSPPPPVSVWMQPTASSRVPFFDAYTGQHLPPTPPQASAEPHNPGLCSSLPSAPGKESLGNVKFS